MVNLIESRIKNGFSAVDVILSMANYYKFVTSEFVKSESVYYIIILTDRNEHAVDPMACLDANGVRPFADNCRISSYMNCIRFREICTQPC